ncbi:MAG TPA: PLP-dependent aspartate aminotransferase family protein [Myxococcota bacterium]|nr:PLP-dependent aspartate aminotransferase family protein [Myxococcota bacterium]
MSDHPPLRFASRCIHAGQSPEPRTGAVMQPVFQTSTYAQAWPARHTGYEYARTHNPTREALERCLAALEGAEHGVAFGSGLAATDAVLHALPAGARIVCGDDVYGGTYRLFRRVFEKRGLEFRFVDLSAVPPDEAIPDGTTLLWLETPTNPLLKVADIEALATRARAVGAIVVVDNTFATPYFQRPLELGADIVVHSTTKYINGHSDVVGGVVITRRADLHEQIRFLQNAVGGVPGPWDAWLTLRGVKTLAVRMERHQANARRVVDWLVGHPEVRAVRYPMLESDPGYAVARRQMSGFGGMISFVLDADLARAERFCASTRLFTCAESLGGVESLIELPASMTHASVPAEERRARGIEDGLIRLSVGIEDADDLLADLQRAMDASRAG